MHSEKHLNAYICTDTHTCLQTYMYTYKQLIHFRLETIYNFRVRYFHNLQGKSQAKIFKMNLPKNNKNNQEMDYFIADPDKEIDMARFPKFPYFWKYENLIIQEIQEFCKHDY